MIHTSRREFLAGVAGIGALASLGEARAAPRQDAPAAAPRTPPFSISLAEWSYHRALHAGELEHRDFARVAKQVHQIDAVEYVSSFFAAEVGDAAYVKELRARADDLGVRILLVMCDGEGDLGAADPAQRAQAVEKHVKWLAAAKLLGCHSIRVNAYGTGTREEHAAQAADGLHRLAALADPLGLDVIVENHGGLSSDGKWLAGVIRKADHPRVGTLPDFGNFDLGGGKQYDRYAGVAEMMPFAKAVSAKCYDFDEAGLETTIDFPRMMRIVHAAGYRGHVGIEYEGRRLSERDGISAMKRLLDRLRSEIS